MKAGTGFYIVSGCGYPSIINHVGDASLNLIEIGNVNHFFIILDADEDDVETRESEIALKVSEYNLPEVTNVHIIVQNRCFETILLANRRVIPRNAETEPLMSYKRYYNVVEDNPEDMGPYDVQRFTHSQFHAEYAIKALREKRIRYSKANPSSISNSAYFQDIINRVGTTEHLKSFKVFIEKLNAIRLAIN